MQRHIGLLGQGFGVLTVTWSECEPDARPNVDNVSTHAVGLTQPSTQVASNSQGGDLVFNFTGDHREFVACNPGDRIGVSCHGLDSPSDLGENKVTRLVAKPVVYMLEVVEVGDHNSQLAPSAPRVHQGFAKTLVEQAPVRKTGQLVMKVFVPKELRIIP
jgi:hypothetical protein